MNKEYEYPSGRETRKDKRLYKLIQDFKVFARIQYHVFKGDLSLDHCLDPWWNDSETKNHFPTTQGSAGETLEQKIFTPSELYSLQLAMARLHGERYKETTQEEALEQRHQTFIEFMRYLSFVPLGQGGSQRISIEGRQRTNLFDRCGGRCEACNKKIENSNFQLHHINYYKGNNPEYIKVVCQPCHEIINTLTGVTRWFENEVKTRVKPS